MNDVPSYDTATSVWHEQTTLGSPQQIDDPSLPRPWSVHSVGSSTYHRTHGSPPLDPASARATAQAQRDAAFKADLEKKQQHLRALYKHAEDPFLREYLDVMRPRSKARTWTNDDVAVLTAGAGEEAAKGKKGPKIEAVAVKNKKYGGEGQMVTKVHVKFADSDDEMYDDLLAKENRVHQREEGKKEKEEDDDDEAAGTPNDAVRGTTMSDLEYLKLGMTLKDDEDVEQDQDDSSDKTDGEEEDGGEEDEDGDEGKRVRTKRMWTWGRTRTLREESRRQRCRARAGTTKPKIPPAEPELMLLSIRVARCPS
ncbi:hypothetical protein BC937DRAFT_86575, partial [Endogone sp. FLAS-F59071]